MNWLMGMSLFSRLLFSEVRDLERRVRFGEA
jgi:hypothetical protein